MLTSTTRGEKESSTFSSTFSTTMNTTDRTTLENRTSSYNTESTTIGAVDKQSTSFLIPVSILFSVGLFIIAGVICFYARKWRRHHRRKPLPLPHPYPENEMLVRYRSADMEENGHCLDESRNLISPSSTETEFPEESPFRGTMAEPVYANESTSVEGRASPIYENYVSPTSSA